MAVWNVPPGPLIFFSHVTIHYAMSKKQKSYYLPPMSKCSFCTRHPHHYVLSMFSVTLCHQPHQEPPNAHVEYDFGRGWQWFVSPSIFLSSVILHNNKFFLLDSMFMNIEPEEAFPCLLPANLNHTFDLLDNGWCYHHTRFNVCQLQELYHHLDLPVSLTISTRQHKAS
jgi:hypothetical protein